MASPSGRMRPWRYLAAFAGVVAVLYALVFLTGDRQPTPELGIDLQGGTRVTLTAVTPNGTQPTPEQLTQAKQIIEQRVNGLGVSGAQVVRNGRNLVITVPGKNGDQARQLSRTAKLYFRPVVAGPVPVTPGPQPGPQPNAPVERQPTTRAQQVQALRALNCATADPVRNADPSKPLVTCLRDGTAKYILGPSILSGERITGADFGLSQRGAGYIVTLDLDGRGSDTWASYTGAHVGQQVAFTLDGRVVSPPPQIQGAIPGGQTQITGNFSQAEASDLANVLKYGALPLSFNTSAAQTVSATLGLASLRAGLIAGAVGLAVVFVYCLFYYRALGVLTILSLVLSGTIVYSVLVLFGRWIGFTLDLAGVAGFIFAIGVTADSFVVFFERLKDEIRDGRSFRSAVPRGWPRARRTILAADTVSFLAAAVLYALAVGDVQGFAFTLGLSTVLDLIVVFLVTHPLVALASWSKTLSRPSLSGLGAVQRLAPRSRAAGAAAAEGA